MTSIATKGGAVIVKDGKAAEGCGCCGGWYCCMGSQCFFDAVTSVRATVVATDYYDCWRAPDGATFSRAFFGSLFNGTHQLLSSGNAFPQVIKRFDSQFDLLGTTGYLSATPRVLQAGTPQESPGLVLNVYYYEFPSSESECSLPSLSN